MSYAKHIAGETIAEVSGNGSINRISITPDNGLNHLDIYKTGTGSSGCKG